MSFLSLLPLALYLVYIYKSRRTYIVGRHITDGGSNRGCTVSYDTGYDDGSRSLANVACSDGQNGLITRYGWQTQGQVARFPYIGGIDAVDRWNSPNVSGVHS
jgi:hypothetical protein